jgi:glycogen(starch) synthase
MKVLYVVQNYFPSIGGTQILFQSIAEKCREYYGDESIVYTSNSLLGPDKKEFKKIEQSAETINGVAVHRFPFIRIHYWLSSKIMMAFKLAGIPIPQMIQRYRSGPWSPSLTKAMNTTNADVIVASSCNYLYMLYPLTRHKLKNSKPFVFQGAVHFSAHSNNHSLFNKTLEAIKQSDCYLANTGYEKERLVQLGVPAGNIVVTGIGIDVELYANGKRQFYRNQFGLSEDDVLIGYIGRIEPTKAIDILLQAFQAIKEKAANSHVHLVVAGFKSAYVNELERLIESLGGTKNLNIHLRYNISLEEKVNLYHAIDVYVMPSVHESFGIVFLEAWCCRKPVIGANIGAIASVIEHEVDGLLMEPNSYLDLAKKMQSLITDKELREHFGSNGFKKTTEQFTWPAVAKKYHDAMLMAIEKFKRNQPVKPTLN